MQKIKRRYTTILLVLVVLLLFFTRFYNLSWGLPYPFHPDERNMAVALQRLHCGGFQISNFKFQILQDCFNPHFFAYGQFPLYVGFFLLAFYKSLVGTTVLPISLSESMIVLRIISATASIGTVFLLFKIVKLLHVSQEQTYFKGFLYFVALLFISSPALIQFAHFGTTESLLMLLYSGIVYVSLLFIKKQSTTRLFIYSSATFAGLAVATKVSSLIFLTVPLFVFFSYLREEKKGLLRTISFSLRLVVVTLVVSIIFSPQSVISFNEFLGSLRYEMNVAQGLPVFYTHTFDGTIPVLFQLTKILPFALGWPNLLLFMIGFFLLPFKKEYNLLRISFLVYFLPVSFLFTKWTRFVAPVFPVILLIIVLFLLELYKKFQSVKALIFLTTILAIIPGVAYFSMYILQDTRITASHWIFDHVPSNTYLLSETANVVDIPLPVRSSGNLYTINSFNFYELDRNLSLGESLERAIQKADYIIIPSRRIFKNFTCLQESQKCRDLERKYPLLNEYYRKLFSGELGFKKVAEISSYPQISLFGKRFIFPDEDAEETWTVFDHPVIRIYKKI